MEKNQKKQPAKRIQLVDVVLERKGSQLFSGRRVRSPEVYGIIIVCSSIGVQTIYYTVKRK